ncbi:MAG: GntR family transcriptional regulator [Actinobacteria bacterium]|nr:GntR family transcriptional regulator [Cyanobacteriota bacterium]MCL6087131.1 GntR family transcriptional regulator [Actinomycetota bacterium]
MKQIKLIQDKQSNQAYQKIKLLILENKLKPGEKIIQYKLAQTLNISLTPIIQALSILQNEKLIDYLPRKGFFVRKISDKEFYDLLEIRSFLESLAIEKISENINDSIRNQLLKFKKKFILLFEKNKLDKYFELDKKFHYYLIEASNNSYLININNTFNILLLCYTMGLINKINISIEHHKNIIDAILNNEKDRAISLIIEHLNVEHLNSAK